MKVTDQEFPIVLKGETINVIVQCLMQLQWGLADPIITSIKKQVADHETAQLAGAAEAAKAAEKAAKEAAKADAPPKPPRAPRGSKTAAGQAAMAAQAAALGASADPPAAATDLL